MVAVLSSVISSWVLIFLHFVHELLAVDDFDALGLESEQHRHLDHVDADRFVVQACAFPIPA